MTTTALLSEVSADLVISITPSGVIVYWPDTHPASALREADDLRHISTSSTFAPLPRGKELAAASDSEHSGANPEWQLFASADGDSEDGPIFNDEPSFEGEMEEACQLP